MLAHDLLINLLVYILEMDIIQNVSVFLEILHGIHVAVVEVAGVEAEACDLIGHILHIAGDLIGELDVGAGVRVDHGTDAPAVGALAHCADVAHELFPLLIVHAGCAVHMAGVEVTVGNFWPSITGSLGSLGSVISLQMLSTASRTAG